MTSESARVSVSFMTPRTLKTTAPHIFKTLGVVAVSALALGLAGCGSDGGDDDTIVVGTSPGPYSDLFKDGIAPILEDEGYTVEFEDFSELQQADVALSEGSVDINVDQHTAYMENFNEETSSDLESITEIPTVPAGLYSENYDDLDEVSEGDTVGIPQDASNQARAYNMLDEMGWITLDSDADPATATHNDVAENPHDLDLQPVDSATIPRSLSDLDWGVIPGSIAYSSDVDADLQYFQETLSEELILVAVVQGEDADSDWAEAVADAYDSDEFADFMDEENADGYWHVPETITAGEGGDSDGSDDSDETDGSNE